MNNMKKFRLPKKERPAGLYLFCNSCDKRYLNDSKIKCRCDNLVYKAKIHISGTKDGTRFATFHTESFEEAVQHFFAFKRELKNNSFQKVSIKKQEQVPIRLVECFAYYIGYLNNVGVPMHKIKERKDRHIKTNDMVFMLGNLTFLAL